MKKVTLFTIFSILATSISFGQKKFEKDSLKAEYYFQKGVDFRAQGQFIDAINAFDSAIYHFHIAQDTGLYFITMTDKSWCYILMGQFDEALDVTNAALEEVQSLNFDQEGIFYRQKGIIYSNMSDFEKSYENFLKAKEIAERKYGVQHNRYARALADLSISHHRMGQFDKALEYRMMALTIETKNGVPIRSQINSNLNLGAIYYEISDYNRSLDHGLIALELSLNDPNQVLTTTANLYENIGNCYKAMGQYKKAIDHYQKTMDIRKNVFGDTHYKIANTYQNLAGSYSQIGDSEKALEAYQASYAMRVETLGESHLRTIEGLKHLGVGYLDVEEYDLAEIYLFKALEQERVKHGEKHREISLTLNNLGHLYYKKSEFEKSIQFHEEAAEMFIQLYGNKGSLLSRIYESLAKTYFELKDYSNAIDAINRAMVANGMMLADDEFSPPLISNYARLRSVLESMMLKIKIIEASTFDLDKSEVVIQHVDSISELIHEIKGNFTNKSDLFFLIEIYHDFVGKAVSHLYANYQKSGNQDLLYKALSYIESSKDNLLIQKLHHLNAREFATVPDSIIIKEKSLKAKLEEANNRLISRDSTGQELAFDLSRELDRLTSYIEQEYPSYYKLNYAIKRFSEKDFKRLASDSDITSLSYFLDEDSLYCIVLSKNQSKFVSIPLSGSFIETVHSFRKAISDAENESYDEYAAELFSILFMGIEDQVIDKSIIIISDGILATIPFEILQIQNGKYLMEEANISYSSSLKYLISNTNSKKRNQQYVGFAPSFNQFPASVDPIRNELTKLPGASEEVNAISNMLSGESFINENASETNFRNVAEKYGLIHLATHAIIDDSNPDHSRMVFSLLQDSINDGYLHAYEIYNLNLNANLITLSACNTGFGEVKKGEGVMSLSRAFAYAGVPATVVSLWPASDKSTPELMKYFYQNLKEGQPKDVALNNARKSYLATAQGKARHPFYWGGFVLIGDNSPIEEDRNLVVWVLPVLIIFVLIGTVLRRGRH